MMSVFGNVNDMISEGKARWGNIEQLLEEIQSGDLPLEEQVNKQTQVLVLLVQHLAPMNPTHDQLDEMMGGLRDLVSAFGGKK